jgi:hypothetical protein
MANMQNTNTSSVGQLAQSRAVERPSLQSGTSSGLHCVSSVVIDNRTSSTLPEASKRRSHPKGGETTHADITFKLPDYHPKATERLVTWILNAHDGPTCPPAVEEIIWDEPSMQVVGPHLNSTAPITIEDPPLTPKRHQDMSGDEERVIACHPKNLEGRVRQMLSASPPDVR